MKNVILLVMAGFAGWYGYSQYQQRSHPSIAAPEPAGVRTTPTAAASPADPFKCDGRIYCSQMASCAEATYFLRNCPGTKMDGDNDGVPCETQWCR